MKGKIVRYSPIGAGAVGIGSVLLPVVPDLCPLGLDGIVSRAAHLNRTNLTVLGKAARARLTAGVVTDSKDRAVLLIEYTVRKAGIHGDNILKVGISITHGPLRIPHLLQTNSSICGDQITRILSGIVVQAQLTAGIEAPAKNLGCLGLIAAGIQLDGALNQQPVLGADSHVLDIGNGLHITVPVGNQAAIGSQPGKRLVGALVCGTVAVIEAAHHKQVVVSGLAAGIVGALINHGAVAGFHVNNIVKLALVVHMTHLGVSFLIGAAGQNRVSVNMRNTVTGTPSHHGAILPKGGSIGVGSIDVHHIPQGLLGPVAGTALAHAGSGAACLDLNRGSSRIGTVHITQLIVVIQAPGPNSTILTESQSVSVPCSYSDDIVNVLGGNCGHGRDTRHGRRARRNDFAGPFIDHGGNLRDLRHGGNFSLAGLSHHPIGIQPLAAGGRKAAQLAVAVIAPGPDLAVLIHGDGEVTTGGHIHDTGEVLTITLAYLNRLRPVTIVAHTQLAIVILTPGPDSAVRLQADSEIIPTFGLGGSDLGILVLKDPDMDHAVFAGKAGVGVAHHLHQNVGLAIAIILSIHLHRTDGEDTAVQGSSGHILIGGGSPERSAPNSHQIIGQTHQGALGHSVFLKELEAGHILQSRLGNVDGDHIVGAQDHIGLLLFRQLILGGALVQQVIQIQGIEVLCPHTLGIVEICQVVIVLGCVGVIQGHAISVDVVAAHLTTGDTAGISGR